MPRLIIYTQALPVSDGRGHQPGHGPASDPEDITVSGQVAYFSACDPAVGREPDPDLSCVTSGVIR